MAKTTRHGGATNQRVEPIITRPHGKRARQAEPAPAPDPGAVDDVYDGLTADELRAELRDRELPTSGTKAELVDRLLDDDTEPDAE